MPDPNSPQSDAAVIPLRARMTPAEYEAERARLRELYGDAPADAAVKSEQALALLFARSGWTQQELAKKEGKSQKWVDFRLRFGRFLNFSTNVLKLELLPINLNEGRFREFWVRTEGDERARFREVVKLMQSETTLARSTIPKGHPKKIVAKFADSKWHSLPVIAKFLDAPEDEVEKSLAGMVKDGRGNAKTETKKVGTVKQYRFFKNERMISSIELIEKLAPIVEELKEQGRRNMVTMDPMAVNVLATRLARLLDEWTE